MPYNVLIPDLDFRYGYRFDIDLEKPFKRKRKSLEPSSYRWMFSDYH